MNKKILLLIGIVVVVGIAVGLVFFGGSRAPGAPEEGFSFGDFFPFGRSENLNPDQFSNNNNDPEENAGEGDNGSVARLRKISKDRVAGSVIWNQGSTTLVRFVERGTGNVYEANSLNNSIRRLTNTTIPKIVRAFWLPDASGFLAQTLMPETELVETSLVKLSTNTATSSEELTPFTTTISKLPTNIQELSINQTGKKIFYYTVDGSISRWFTANPDGTDTIEVFSHALTEWLPKWVSEDTIEMEIKRSAESGNLTYNFSIKNKALTKITPQNISPDTFNEKCVVGNKDDDSWFCAAPVTGMDYGRLDDWYMGTFQTSDNVMKVDRKIDASYQIANLADLSGEKIDVIDIAISKDESHLVFRNKVDEQLWVLRIEE